MSNVFFDTNDWYGQHIELPKEPLINILYRRLDSLKDGHNNLVQEVIDKTTKMGETIDHTTALMNSMTVSVDALRSSTDIIMENINTITENLDLLQLRAIDAISAEEMHRILKMKASPDEENHVMAREIIKSKLTEAGLLTE